VLKAAVDSRDALVEIWPSRSTMRGVANVISQAEFDTNPRRTPSHEIPAHGQSSETRWASTRPNWERYLEG